MKTTKEKIIEITDSMKDLLLYKNEKEIEIERYTAEQAWHDACCLLDFGIFDGVQMFDENGKEYTEFY